MWSLGLPWVMFKYFLCFNRWFQAISVLFLQSLMFIFQVEENATPFETVFSRAFDDVIYLASSNIPCKSSYCFIPIQ